MSGTVFNPIPGNSTPPDSHVSDPSHPEAMEPSLAAEQTLVQQARAEVRQLVREIEQWCRADVPPDEFYPEFLDRVVAALAAAGGAIWTPDPRGCLRLRYEVGLPESIANAPAETVASHVRLVERAIHQEQTLVIPPSASSAGDPHVSNPTPWLLVLGPLRTTDRDWGVVQIFQRPDGGPIAQRGYARFLSQMCQLAKDYFTMRRLSDLERQLATWRETERYIEDIHRDLDPHAVAGNIANEMRRLLGVDRVSVGGVVGKRNRILAVSGLDAIDDRAAEVVGLNRLGSLVTCIGEPLWFPEPSTELAPELEDALQRHIDRSAARSLGVIPLRTSATATDLQEDSAEPAPRDRSCGFVLIERFQGDRIDSDLAARAALLAQHGAAAMTNALEHDSLPLRPLGRALRSVRQCGRTQRVFVHATAAVIAAALVLGMLFMPVTLRIPAQGQLLAADRQHVFTQVDGTVDEVLVSHGQIVEQGQVLARLRNEEIELELAELIGRQATISEQLLATERALLNNSRLVQSERDRLSAELAQRQQLVVALQRQIELQQRRAAQLVIRSPRSGQVVTWDVSQRLLYRPVERGQRVLSVADPSGPWELNLLVRQRDIGPVLTAQHQSTPAVGANPELYTAPKSLATQFSLETHPGREFAGQLVEIEKVAEAEPGEAGTVRVRVAVARDQLPELRHGAVASAWIACGRRAAAYVWFRELVDRACRQWVYWF